VHAVISGASHEHVGRHFNWNMKDGSLMRAAGPADESIVLFMSIHVPSFMKRPF
jgi:hypothetical protein